MNVLWLGKLLLIVLIAVCLMQLLRGRGAAMAIPCSLALGLLILWTTISPISALWQKWQTVFLKTGLETSLFLPLVKVVAITELTRLCAELCRDAGEKAAAAGVELGGAAAALICTYPLAEKALELIGGLGS